MKGNFGSFVRLPDFLELFGNRGAVIGNPLLQPEEGRSFDAGFITTHSSAGGIVRQFRLEMAYFETLAENLIQFEPTGQQWVVARNTGRARIKGVEMGISLMLGPRLTGSLNATRQDAVSEGGDIFDGKFLVGRPRDELSTRLDLSLGRWNLYHAFTYVGPNFVDRLNTVSQALAGPLSARRRDPRHAERRSQRGIRGERTSPIRRHSMLPASPCRDGASSGG